MGNQREWQISHAPRASIGAQCSLRPDHRPVSLSRCSIVLPACTVHMWTQRVVEDEDHMLRRAGPAPPVGAPPRLAHHPYGQ